jgi:hypothetical protein
MFRAAPDVFRHAFQWRHLYELLKELYTVLPIGELDDIRRSLHGLREKLGMA